ncbi:hypothetical protein OAA72_01920 [Amylibacter sp.]|nr:hypothetical protein [Amylibacter sp.]
MVSKYCEYLWLKGGFYFFRRHVPVDVQKHYERSCVVICLKTRSKASALRASRSIASKLDDFWMQLRLSEIDVPASHLLVKGKPKKAFLSNAPKLSKSLVKYFELKGLNKTALFFTSAKRNIRYVTDHIGDNPIDAYTSANAASFRDSLSMRGLSASSINRVFSSVRAVVNLSIQENGLGCSNAFANIYLPKKVTIKRKPIPNDEIINIQNVCLNIADERRLFIALISDTGMRPSEAVGLVLGDVVINHEFPILILFPTHGGL